MADAVDKIVNFKVDYSDLVNGMKQINSEIAQNKEVLKSAQAEYAAVVKGYKAGKVTLAEVTNAYDTYSSTVVETTQQNKALTAQMRLYEKELQSTIKQESAAKGSLDEMRGKVTELTTKYNALSKEAREGEAGKNMAADIKSLRDETSDAEKELGMFTSEVGNYENAIKNALPMSNDLLASLMSMSKSADGSTAGVKTLTANIWGLVKGMIAFVATPIGIVLTAIAIALKALSAGFSSSEGNMNRFSALVAPLELLLDGLVGVLQKAVGGLLSLAEGAANMLGALMKMAEKIPIAGDLIKDMNDEIERSIELEKESAALVVKAREDEVLNAKNALEVSKLRSQSKDLEKYTAQERLAFLDKANKLEEEKAMRNMELKARELAILAEKAERTDNDAAINDELAKKQAEVYAAQMEYFNKTRELQEQSNTLNKEIAADRLALIENEKQAQAELRTLALSLYEKSAESEKAILEDQTNNAVAEIQNRLDTEENLTKAAREALNGKIIALYTQMGQQMEAIDDKYNAEALEKAVASKQAQYEREEQELALNIERVKQMLATDPNNTDLQLKLQLYTEQQRTQQLSTLQATLTDLRNLTEEEQSVLFESQADYLDAMLGAELDYTKELNKLSAERIANENAESTATIQIRQSTASSVANSLGTISSAISTIGEENRQAVIASQTLALAEVAIHQGLAIAKATSAASTLVPPANYFAIAASVATIIAQMVSSVRTIKSAEFSTGGYVDASDYYADGGLVTGAGTSTSDSIPAMLSNGEFVANAQATADYGAIFSALNVASGGSAINTKHLPSGGDGTAGIEAAMTRAIASMPNPIVSVKDINKGQRSVQVQDNISRLR
ncbi:MAG: hypothetical protein R3Y68_06340 [Rikenellaceae bacterium]